MIRGAWTLNTIAWLIAVSLLPVAAMFIVEQGTAGAVRLGLGVVIIAAWQLVFAVARGQPLSAAGAVPVVAFAVLAPGEVAVWQLLLALSFGVVIGELVFGGWGRNVLNAAVVALAFLFFSFPGMQPAPASAWIGAASVPGAVVLLVTGILSWRMAIGFVLALIAVTLAMGADVAALPLQGGLVFALVFLVGDPVSAAATNPGRWLYGALAGALVALFGWSGETVGAPQSIVSATLLASIFAPLIDHGVVAAKSYLRKRRYG